MTRAPALIQTKSYARQYGPIWCEIQRALRRTFFEDEPVLGETLIRFEASLARSFAVRHAVGVGSGTDALSLLLSELSLSSGDEIVTCAHTFAGVLVALVRAGARPVLVDADPETMLLDASELAHAFSKHTRAVLAVHMYGHPVDFDAVSPALRGREVLLLEDAAQAHGATWRDRPVGSFGAASILSFHPSKNLGGFGDGGAVLTSDAGLAERLRVKRNLGKSSKYGFSELGPNTKLDTLQAAILEVKLRYLNEWNQRRRALAAIYDRELAGVGDLVLPRVKASASHVFHLYVVRTKVRAALRRYLSEHGIGTGMHYPVAAHRQPALSASFAGQRFPVAESIAEQCVSLPLSHEHTPDELEQVVDRVRAFYGR